MARSIATALLCFGFILHPSSFILAQDIPLVGQPSSDFYGAAGSGVKVAWAVERNVVPEDGELVATLTISNATNPRKITRPDLKKLPEFNDRFAITDNPDRPIAEGSPEVQFSYRLRPRNRKTDQIPTLNFYYFNTAAPAGKQFKLTNTGRPIPIKVTAAAPKVPPPPMPLVEPEHLFAIATGPALLDRGAVVASWAWLLLGVAGPLFALGWYAAWRRLYPDAQRLATIRRTRAARRAMDAITWASHTHDPPAAIAAAMLGYLRSRFPLPPGAVTPSELAVALAEIGMPTADCEQVAEFFRACDAARFAPSSDNAVSLAADASAIVARLEAA
ncbi:MAG: hypothetical protein C0467_11410 [Planctomycetaceae bacterium]|nr:hypothetical protein [Planctomycetaceae bacterium]